ncbi:hypothetical protein [Neorhizobium galegae]|uniref:hypothetical protein n=1 Tax=Neorhizobium galegae TaxID=399 RepID=UPI002106780A|nr:hypothetical protein [Neorhizobium galegae]MCQ1850395.1 hypothetical protein [Neorhizobium galegae]
MNYTFPPSLYPLRNFLKKWGFDGDSVKGSIGKGHTGIVGNERADELSLVGRQHGIKQAHIEAALPVLAFPVNESGQSAGFGFAPVDNQNIGDN